MAPRGGFRGGFRGRGRGRGRGGPRGGARGGRRDTFTTARIEDPVSDDESENGLDDGMDVSGGSEGEEEDVSEEEEVSEPSVRPYNALLQSFKESAAEDQPRRKRRKVEHEPEESPEPQRVESESPAPHNDSDMAGSEDEAAMGENDQAETELIDEDEDASDPFEVHFTHPEDNELSQTLKAVAENQWTNQKIPLQGLGKCLAYSPGLVDGKNVLSKRSIRSTKDLKLKKKLVEPAESAMPEFGSLEQAIVPHVFDYKDVLFGARSVRNAESLRKIYCLHALNHIFKTRDRVIKNNARLAKEPENEDIELRDQGFTRPKVLILLETRQSCVRVVDTITALCEPEQQENKKRFQDGFVETEQKFGEDRPEDFRELFEGNDDNEFRLGMKFTRKTIKFFSQFYNSDIIFASPLGLRRAIEQGDPKKKDSDFLSSIELVIMDQADAMLMQNWEHVEYVFQHLNLQPKDAHGCDFSRVRSWYLDGNAKYLRQTIVLSAYLTPELNSLFNKHMQNVAGKIKYQPEYEGAIMDIGLQVKQTFSRYESPSPANDPDARFKYFTTAIVPALNKYPKPPDGAQGILVFIPSYLDFVRIRNYFATSQATQHISFGAVSEYTDMPDVRRARSHFFTGRHSVLLYTGRAHHFRRYHIRGVKRVIMYALPENPIFYSEIVGGYLSATMGEGKLDPAEASVRVIFSKWDGLRLERVVGSKRVGSMLRDKSGDTFDFV